MFRGGVDLRNYDDVDWDREHCLARGICTFRRGWWKCDKPARKGWTTCKQHASGGRHLTKEESKRVKIVQEEK